MRRPRLLGLGIPEANWSNATFPQEAHHIVMHVLNGPQGFFRTKFRIPFGLATCFIGGVRNELAREGDRDPTQMHFQPLNPCKDRIHKEPPFRGVGFLLSRIQFSHWDLDGRIVNADQPQPLKDFLGRSEVRLVAFEGIVRNVERTARHVGPADGADCRFHIQERTALPLSHPTSPPFFASPFPVIRLLMDWSAVLVLRRELTEML